MAPNTKQFEAWNGGESVHYVDHAVRYDHQLAPFTEALLEQVGLTPRRSLLDVGCGCGALTLAAARIADSAVGVDFSAPLTEVASERARTEGDRQRRVRRRRRPDPRLRSRHIRPCGEPVRSHVLR